MTSDHKETATQIAQAIPSILAVIHSKVLGLSIDNWLGLCGIAFLVIQAAYLLWKWRRDWTRERSGLPPAS